MSAAREGPDPRIPEALGWAVAGLSLAGLVAELLVPELRLPFLPAEAHLFFAVLACGLSAVVAVLAYVQHRLSRDVLSLGVAFSFAVLATLAQFGLSVGEPLSFGDGSSAVPGAAIGLLLAGASIANRRYRKSSSFRWRPFLWGLGFAVLLLGLAITLLHPFRRAGLDVGLLARPWHAVSLAFVAAAGYLLTRSRSDRGLRRCLILGLVALAVSELRLLLMPVPAVSAQPFFLLASIPVAAFFLSRFGESAMQLTSTSVELEKTRSRLEEQTGEAERRTQELTSETLARQRAEAVLAETEARLASVLASAPVALLAFEDGEARVAEGSALSALGLPDRVVGRRVGELFSGRAEELHAYEKAARGEAQSLEMSAPHRVFDLRFVPLPQAERQPGVLVLALDVTERRRAQEDLARSKASLESILESLPDTVLRVSQDGELTSFRPAWDASLGLPARGSFQRLSELLPADLAALLQSASHRVLESGTPETLELRLGEGDAARTHEARVVRSGQGDAVLLLRDVEERKAAEKLRGEVISMVSHELQSPLSAVRGALGLIDGVYGHGLPGEVGSLVETALRSTDRLIRLIQDLLDLEKIESGEIPFRFVDANVADVVRQAVEVLDLGGEEGGPEVRLEVAPDVPVVAADPDRLAQVATNLLSNARKFSPPGGTVVVRVEPSPAWPGGVRVSVSDEGPGIPAAFRQKIFSRFARADGSRPRGTGLGLNITRAIVTKHGGTIGFDTEEGRGTTFHVDLPRGATDRETGGS